MAKNPVFSKAVYAVVRRIPAGRTMTYAEVARMVAERTGRKPCARAVGQALRRNPWPIDKKRCDGYFVPCHRVVRSDSTIGGFIGKSAGKEVERKRRLLKQEGISSF